MLVLLAGCASEPTGGVVEFPTEVRAKSLLVSEINTGDGTPTWFECPVPIVNHSPDSYTVTLLGMGCSCYGATLNGEAWRSNTAFILLPGERALMAIKSQLAPLAEARDFRMSLKLATGGQTREQMIRCDLEIIDDVRMTPAILTLKATTEPLRETRDVTIEHVYRAERPEARTVTLVNAPAGVQLQEVQPVRAAEEVEKNLWRQRWIGKLNLDLPASETLTGSNRMGLEVQKETRIVARGHSDLVIDPSSSLTFPRTVHFGQMSIGQTRKRRLMLSTDGRLPLEIHLQPRTTDSNLKIDVQPASPQRTWVDVEANAGIAGKWSEKLTFTTGLPDQPEIVIEVDGNFVGAES